MFKEAFIFIIILLLFFLLCKILYKRKKRLLSCFVILFLITGCILNILYNAKNIFPDFYMDIVNGRFRYGTFSGNLFAYSDEFMFRDEIIYPILKNRQVQLDSSAEFYQKFFTLYSDSCHSITITEEERAAVMSHRNDFDFTDEFSCMGIMDYVKDSIPANLEASFDAEEYPDIYIQTASLKEQQNLMIVMDQDYSLYIMSESYFKQITGGNS